MEKEILERIKAKLRAKRENAYQDMLDYWKNRQPFRDENDIPDLPQINKDDYEKIIVPNVIRCGGIPKDKLEIGKTYVGSCRNASEAVWGGEHFTYMRTKFGCTYPEEINHFEDDNGSDLFVPIKEKE